MKKIEGYQKSIEIEGVSCTITMIKRTFEGTRVFYDSYLTNDDTQNTILLDNMEQNHPVLGYLSVKRIMEMAEEQAQDCIDELFRIDMFTNMIDIAAEQAYDNGYNHGRSVPIPRT